MSSRLLLLLLVAVVLCAGNVYGSVQTCLKSAGVNYLDSGSGANWSSAKTPFNKRLQYTPVAIAYPTSANQVSAAVKCGLNNYYYINARGGGHSYAASAFGGENGHLMIDMSKMASVAVTGESATVGGGAKLGDVASALNKYGRALPHGVCPYVGVGGHAAGGGYGTYSSRTWGLLLDRLTSMQVVTAEGTVRNLTSTSADSDLYWAMRGAGFSYGIIVSYTFQTLPVPANVVVAKYDWDNVSANSSAAIFAAYQDFTSKSVDAAWGSVLNVYKGTNAGTIKLNLQATYIGTQAAYTVLAQGLLAKLSPAPATTSVSSFPKWIDAVQNQAGSQSLNTASAKDYTDTFYAKSVMTPESAPVSAAGWSSFANYLANPGSKSDTSWFAQIELYGGPGSAINTPKRTDTAFVHRSSLFNIQLYASSKNYGPPYPSDGISFVQGLADSITNPMGAAWNYEAYQNYPDTQFTAAQAQKLIYAENYARLQTVKAKYDPRKVFKLPAYLGIVA